MKLAAIYAIVVGVLMVGQWLFFLATGRVPELETEPVRIGFHLAAEFLTADALIVGGAGLLTGRKWALPVYLVAMGMLLYTLVVSPGYFVQQSIWAQVGMFAVLLVLALVSLGLVLKEVWSPVAEQ